MECDATDRQMVRKSYELITAKNKWSEIESKLLATFIKELNPMKEDDFRELNISIESIQKLWGVQVHTTHIRNLCLELKRKVYEIPQYKLKTVTSRDGEIHKVADESKIKSYKYISLFDTIEYVLDEKFIRFKFDDMMIPHLLKFNRFIKYKIGNILLFKCRYSISFYEYFKSQMFKKEIIKTIVLDVDYMHVWLETPKSYKTLYSNFKSKILIPVVNDLKNFTDIYVVYKEKKVGKKVEQIEFKITKNLSDKEKQELEADKNNKELQLRKKPFLKYIGFSCLYDGRLFKNITDFDFQDNYVLALFQNGSVIKFKKIEDIESIILEE